MRRCARSSPAARSCATYADGVADIDLAALRAATRPRARSRGDGRAARAAVRRRRAGEDGRVEGFREKPRAEHWVNGGFFVLRAGVRRYSARTPCSSASRSSGSPPTASSTRTATRASGPAWTPTRTRSRSTTCGPPGAPWAAGPARQNPRHGRSFQMGGDQAQEGDRRRPPRQALHEARARDHRRGEGGRRRRRGQPVARPGRAEGQGRLDAEGQHRARDRQGHRRGRGRRALESITYEGYGPAGVALLVASTSSATPPGP